MSKLSRYTLSHFLKLLAITLISLIVLFLVIDYIEKTSKWTKFSSDKILTYYIHFIPHILFLIFPISTIIASVFSIGKLSANLELTAMSSAGISTFRILLPILIFGILLSCFMIFFVHQILPESNFKRFQILQPQNYAKSQKNSNIKFKFIHSTPKATFYFRYYYPKEAKGNEVFVLFKKDGNLTKRIDAPIVKWTDSVWTFYNGSTRIFEKGKEIETISFEKKALFGLQTKPTDFVGERKFPDEMSLKYLSQKIKLLKLSGESFIYFETQWHLKIANCFVSLIMLIIGLSVSINTRKKGLSKRFGFVILIFFSHFATSRIGVSLGENGHLSPIHAAWLASYIFGGASFLLMVQKCRK